MTGARGPVIPTGRYYHTGYVVKDVRAALKHWVEQLGVGPWVLFENLTFVDPVYRGQPGGPAVTLAFAAAGDHFVELIQQHDALPSIYRETRGALHHLGVSTCDLDAEVHRYEAAGVRCAFRGNFSFGGGCAYLDTLDTLGTFTEVVEFTPAVQGMLAAMQAASRDWNRTDYTFSFE